MYLVKKEKNQRILRLYQCKCDLKKFPKEVKGAKVVEEETSTVNKYQTAKALIERGMFKDMPLKLFADERKSCNMVFCSMSKFFAHLRIHIDEKPFVCPI